MNNKLAAAVYFPDCNVKCNSATQGESVHNVTSLGGLFYVLTSAEAKVIPKKKISILKKLMK